MRQRICIGAEYWQEQMRRAADHPGSVRSYCEANGIRRQAFYYWKKKLGNRGKFRPVANPFTKVEVISPVAPEIRPGRMPDPKWLAEFLLALGVAR